MILVIGGYAAGKRSYVRDALGYSDAQMADGVLDARSVIYNAQTLAARMAVDELLEALCQKEVVVCNEVGGGLIPMNAEDRAAREAAGRLCILLAQRAQRVVRIVCGLPQTLKG